MITPMSKIELFVLKEDLEKTVSLFHDLGILHIEQMPLTPIMEQRGISYISLSQDEEEEKNSCELLIKETNELIQKLGAFTRSCLKDLEEVKEKLKTKTLSELTEIVFKELKPPLNSLTQEIALLKEELRILPQYKQILESFLISKRELKIHQDLACLALIFNRRYEKDMQIFKRHLEDKTKTQLQVYTAYLNPKEIVALVFYPPTITHQIDAEIFKKGTLKIELPTRFLGKTIQETINFIQDRLSHIPQQLQRLNQALYDYAEKKISLICSIRTVALNRLEEIRVRSHFLTLRYTVAITAWIPTKDLKTLTQELDKFLNKKFAIYDRTHSVKHPQQIPVLLENPKRIKPFELLLGLLPPPKYGTKDATGLVSLFFPLFFGLIVGDIGYGLIFLCVSFFLKNSVKNLTRSLAVILFNVSLSSIFFGFLYGEFLGNLGRDYFKLPHILFDRHASIIPFLILAICVGVFHMSIGFFLGIIKALHKKHKKEALEKISIFGALLGLFLLVGALIEILPSRFLPTSIVLLIVVSLLLIILRGFLGPLEAISAVANILSYARLMALGLAGVMMANIANRIGGLAENILIGIILASLLHALNLVLSIFSPTIQSLRLHYVEFFSKFYEPGGKKYNPFRRKEVQECIP